MPDVEKSLEVLRTLDKIGAINLEALVSRSDEIRESLASSGYQLEPGDICYKFTMHIGPHLLDIVQVASEVRELGFSLNRIQ